MTTATLTARRLDPGNLHKIELSHGTHTSRTDGVCAMEAIAWLAGEPHTDTPHCVCPSIAEIIRDWNDALTHEERNNILKPILLTVLNTNQGQELERTRRTMAGDWLLHEGLSNWLHICGLPQQAQQAEELPRITQPIGQTQVRQTTDFLRAASKHVELRHQQALNGRHRHPDRYHSMHHLDRSGFSVVTPAVFLPAELPSLAADLAGNCAHTADILGNEFRPTVERLQVSTADLITRMAKLGE